jgi:lipid-A-disaccharide synthase-like uncharacterized protein
MDQVIFQSSVFGKVWIITPWKLVGYLGVALFSGRWFVQVIASHRARRSHLPHLFWYMSLVGSLLLLSYFALSAKRDSVGILSNLFPSTVATYNLLLLRKKERGLPQQQQPGS